MTREEFRVLCTVCLGTFLFFNSFGSINVALPHIQREFAVSLAIVQWVSIAGVVLISTLSICFGRAGDILGRRKLYQSGIMLYALGAGLCAMSQSIVQLLIFRGVMALGLSIATPMSGAILASNFAPQRRGWALGWYAATSAVGRATGPTLGGIILHFFRWRVIFLMNLMVGLLVSAAVFLVLKGKDERYPDKFDFIGALALIVAYPSLLIGLTLGAKTHWAAPMIPVWFLAAAVGTASFVWIELHARKPLIEPSFFRNLPFSGALLSIVMFTAMHSPVGILGPLYMVNVLGYSSFFVGVIMTAMPVFTALASPASGKLADKFDSRYVAVLGLVFLVAGIWMYAHLGTRVHYLWVAVSLSLMGTGVGFFMPANQRTAFAAMEPENYGIVAAMLSSFNTGSGTLGITVAVVLLEHLMGARGVDSPELFASAQQFSFLAMLPLAGIAIVVLLLGDIRKIRKFLTI
ncbi:MAG: MFS transporter [Desulfobacterales bacterium]|nr:MFS transporter [Desulfobacterales bacterium]